MSNGAPEAVTGFFGILDKFQDPILAILILAVTGLFWLSRKDRERDQERYDKLVAEMREDKKEADDKRIAADRETAQSNNALAQAFGKVDTTVSLLVNFIMQGKKGE